MTIILPISSAKLGKSVHSSISIPKVEDPNPSRIPSGSIPMGVRYAKRGTAWFTGDSVQSVHVVNGDVLLLAKKKNSVPVGIPAPLPITAAVFIQSLTGTSAFTPLSHGEHRNIKTPIKTGHPANGSMTGS